MPLEIWSSKPIVAGNGAVGGALLLLAIVDVSKSVSRAETKWCYVNIS